MASKNEQKKTVARPPQEKNPVWSDLTNTIIGIIIMAVFALFIMWMMNAFL